MKDPLLVDSIVIGRTENRIENYIDGSIIFRDAQVPGVRLVDLVGGSVVIEPAHFVVVDVSDWTMDGDLYMVEIPHNWNLCNPSLTDVNIYDESYELISVDTVRVNANSVIIKVVLPTKIYVSIKKM